MNELTLPDGGRLTYAVDGPADGPVLLLLRPAGGSIELWRELRSRLAARLRVVAFDPRGQGGSSALPIGFTVEQMAGDAAGVLDRLGIRRAHVFGESLGGMVAVELALAHPDRVGRLILASTLTRGRPPDVAAAAEGAKVAACLLESDESVQVCEVERTTNGAASPAAAEHVAQAKERAAELDPRRDSLIGYAAALARVDLRDRLADVRSPVLVIGGTDDRLAPPSEAVRLAHLLPRASVEFIEAGHDVALEAPEACANAITDFIAASTSESRSSPLERGSLHHREPNHDR